MCTVQVELQNPPQITAVHGNIAGATVTSYRRSLLSAPNKRSIESIGTSDKHSTGAESLLGGRRSLLADSNTQNTLDKINETKIKFSSFIKDIEDRVPEKHRKTVKAAIIIAIVLACLVVLCCLWCLIKCVCWPCCCAARMFK